MDPALKELAQVTLHGRDLAETLSEITRIASTAVRGAESTSITLIRNEKGFTAAHDGQLALDADELQYQRGYGPCLDAGRTGLPLLVTDMRAEERWPDYASAVVPAGVMSSMSVPLPFQGATIGALNVYSTKMGSFDDESLREGQEVAAYVAVAVANADSFAAASDLAHQMQRAMESRAVIDMAKGILMAQNRCDPDKAFTMLSQASQRSNRKLRDLAAAIVENVSGASADRSET